MAKKLRDIAGKGQFTGVRKSTVAPPAIDDKNLYNWEGGKDGVDFIKKHDTETHEYPYDADAAFKGKKDGGSKTTKYKFQKDGVYEEAEEELDEKYMGFKKLKASIAAKGGARDPGAVAAAIGRKKYGKKKFQAAAAAGKKLGEASECNHSESGVSCAVHGESACPTGSEPKDMPKGSQKVLLDKKVKEEVELDEAGVRPMGRAYAGQKDAKADSWAKYQKAKSFKQPGTPAKSDLRAIAAKATETGKITKLPAGKAKGLKEEEINEVAPPNPKIEKWIKANKERFVKEYGAKKGKEVLYAKAWKMHGQSESGTATNTDYTGPGAAGWTTGRHDVGTL